MLLLLTFYTKVPIKMITSVAALEIRNLPSLSCVTNKYHDRGNKAMIQMFLSPVYRENVTLWNELVDLRQKHQRQQQIVNKVRRGTEKLTKNCLKEGVRDTKSFMLIMLPNTLRTMSMCPGLWGKVCGNWSFQFIKILTVYFSLLPLLFISHCGVWYRGIYIAVVPVFDATNVSKWQADKPQKASNFFSSFAVSVNLHFLFFH